MQIDRDSTEYLYFGVTGGVPSSGAKVAFKSPPGRPITADWKTAILVNNSSHALWNDAVASGVTGSYYVAILVGAYGGNPVVLTNGDYQAWLQLTDVTEQPVRIAPAVVTVI